MICWCVVKCHGGKKTIELDGIFQTLLEEFRVLFEVEKRNKKKTKPRAPTNEEKGKGRHERPHELLHQSASQNPKKSSARRGDNRDAKEKTSPPRSMRKKKAFNRRRADAAARTHRHRRRRPARRRPGPTFRWRRCRGRPALGPGRR